MSLTETTPAINAAPAAPTISQNFVAKVEKQFVAEMGSPISWTSLQRALAQHLYVKIDASLKALEIKRSYTNTKKNDPPITWPNVNMTKLAIDAVKCVSLELDANIPNHIHVIPYLNKRTQQYDVDIRIGYTGVDHCARRFAVDPPVDIKYQLVHETDKFSYGTENGIAVYHYEQTSPFAPGKVIGGFGYISYEDPRKNRVVIVEYREFEKARKASGGVEFWGGEQTKWENNQKVSAGFDEKFEKEMQFKTVVIRVCKKIALDPAKINVETFSEMSEAKMDAILTEAEDVAVENAGTKELPALVPTSVIQETGEVVEATAVPADAAPPGPEGDLGF